jgi:hypothetical protein
MKPSLTPNSQQILFASLLWIVFLLTPTIVLAKRPAPLVTKIRVAGNTLIEPNILENYLELGNGINMTPEIMDLAVSELKANYNYHGYNFVGAYSGLSVKNGVMTIKVDEKDEYRWGKPRAERATLKRAFLHDITLTEPRKQEIIDTLLKGYEKQRKIEEIVANFLMKKQKRNIEEIQSQRRTSLREKIIPKVREFQAIKRNMEEQEANRIVEMRNRIEASLLRKFSDSPVENSQLNSDEYTIHDEFLDNIIFEEMLNPGL